MRVNPSEEGVDIGRGAQLPPEVVGIIGRVRVLEQDLQCSADRADEGSHKRRRADLF